MRSKHLLQLIFIFCVHTGIAQDYFLKDKAPFNTKIPSPEEFLGYPIVPVAQDS